MAKEYLDAKELTALFFYKTNRRATTATFGQCINQSSNLLKSGFTKEEIIQGIEYCVENPPPKGFNSIGWLSYTLQDILIKIKAQQTKKEMNTSVVQEVEINGEGTQSNREGGNPKPRIGKSYDFKLFK